METMNDSKNVQLGFSEPIENPSDAHFVAHNSPKWIDWDGGKIGGKPSWLNPRDIPKTAPLRCSVCQRRNIKTGCEDVEATPLRFLLQIYSPADSETGNEEAFHRSLYVFCCPHPICSSLENAHESVVVLRGQLPKENEFYPIECDDDDDEEEQDVMWKNHKSDEWGVNLCAICGQRATGRCPASKQWFCCKTHQRFYHKALKKAKDCHEKIDLSNYIYQESELVVEEEPMEQSGEEANVEVDEINKSSMFADTVDKSDELLEQTDLNEMTGSGAEGTSDPWTLEFYTRIGRANGNVKSQCLRYCRWPLDDRNDDSDDLTGSNGPLWISTVDKVASEKDVPCCEYCGAKRRFEFQIMPQMMHYLRQNDHCKNSSGDANDVARSQSTLTQEGKTALLAAADIVNKAKEQGTESDLPEGFQRKQEELVNKFKATIFDNEKKEEQLDFGTIAVFTCTASCSQSRLDEQYGCYRKEFAWRQKPLD
mmetsp:Transcript_8050/g.15166  ORF Transcript_8050/g.15166 Transcript_8050/m.15166 type:complete len:481 (-) Transcript_8050:14-1456(-)